MKKFGLIIIILLSLFILINYKINLYKSKDVSYVVEDYLTTGLFNKYKMYKPDSIQIVFSDNNLAIVDVKGREKKSPHMNVSYKVFLEKKKNGTWKVKKIYYK